MELGAAQGDLGAGLVGQQAVGFMQLGPTQLRRPSSALRLSFGSRSSAAVVRVAEQAGVLDHA